MASIPLGTRRGKPSALASLPTALYAQFIGSHKVELMDNSNMFGMTDTLGQRNPELVKALTHGLTPYMADIASVEGGAKDNHEPLETEGTRPVARAIFAVLGTDVDAYREFNIPADAFGKQYEDVARD